MVVDRTLDKYLADIIFATACCGFEYNSSIKRYQLKVGHITEQMFYNMADQACRIGKKLTVESVNALLQWTYKNAFYYDEIQYSLPVSLLVNGESIRIRFLYNGNECFVDLMKMTESEFLILKTNFGILHRQQFMQIYANDNIGKGHIIYIPSYGNAVVLQTWLVRPLDYHNYADWHFMRDLWRYNVSENIWYAYNSLSEFVNGHISWGEFLTVIDLFNKNGLSTFVFRMMLNSLE